MLRRTYLTAGKGKTNPAILRARWEARQRFLAAQVPITFAGAIARIYQIDLATLQSMVYGNPKPYRTGTMQRRELLRQVDENTYDIFNDAKSGDGYLYPLIVSTGHPGKMVPTSKGKMWYAWVKPPHSRPASGDIAAWERGRAEGWAFRSRRYARKAARNWRKKMLLQASTELSRAFRKMSVDAFKAGP